MIISRQEKEGQNLYTEVNYTHIWMENNVYFVKGLTYYLRNDKTPRLAHWQVAR